MRILVVDDHGGTRELLARNLGREAHLVKCAASCREAHGMLSSDEFDIVVLDIMLPDGSGIELCAALRAEGHTLPVLLLSARGDVHDRIVGLESGADDYLVKPFAVAELVARVRALGRRGPIVRDRAVSFAAVVVDLERRTVTVEGRSVPLTARELAIVEVLATRRGVVSHELLLESVWGDVNESARSSLEVLIGRIRRKLGASGNVLRTVRGLGYSLEPPT